ncbi:MAG: shikimate dehydrogenase [Desulfovibrio sp.]|nr:shikimate dehydrogenase [Desulfovibrio sp.]
MNTLIPENLYGVIGWPLEQTLSPLIHNAGFQALAIPAAYYRWNIDPDSLREFIEAFRTLLISGCSVTIPHKKAILTYLDSQSETTKLAGAANTLLWREGVLYGDNTDVAGFLKPLEKLNPDSVLMLGAGGAAGAVAAGLILKGCRNVRIASPGDRRQYELADKTGFRAIPWRDRYNEPASLTINCTPMGMKGKYLDESPYDFAVAPKIKGGVAYDLVYNPLWTKFLREALANGWNTISGAEMFYFQADGQFRLWTGRDLPDAARDALYRALGAETYSLAEADR